MRKKGFTLIELLAVIVILAIIALIATPTILGVIEKARKGANKDSAYQLMDAARIYYAENLVKSDSQDFANGTTNMLNMIDISGDKPDSGYLYINSKGEVAMAVVYDKMCYKKDFDENDLTELDSQDCTDATGGTSGESTAARYSLTGKLSISDSSIKPVIVVFSETPHYASLDSNGNFKVVGLEKGEHEFYLIKDSNLAAVKAMTKEEIIGKAVLNFMFETGTPIEPLGWTINGVSYDFSDCTITESETTSDINSDLLKHDDVDGDGEADVGEIIAIGDEKFYVIANNENSIDMLSKYNLLVGNQTNNSTNSATYSVTENAYLNDSNYGLQDSRALGCRVGSTTHNGITKFSNSVYWEIPYSTSEEWDSFMLLPEENRYVYSEQSTLYQYVDNYVAYLKNQIGVIDDKISGRILSKTQAENLGCDSDASRCSGAPKWVYSSTYWLGTGEFTWPVPAKQEYYLSQFNVWFIGANPQTFVGDESTNDMFVRSVANGFSCIGVRPVITIDKSLFEQPQEN